MQHPPIIPDINPREREGERERDLPWAMHRTNPTKVKARYRLVPLVECLPLSQRLAPREGRTPPPPPLFTPIIIYPRLLRERSTTRPCKLIYSCHRFYSTSSILHLRVPRATRDTKFDIVIHREPILLKFLLDNPSNVIPNVRSILGIIR